jgi:hypothetical protein
MRTCISSEGLVSGQMPRPLTCSARQHYSTEVATRRTWPVMDDIELGAIPACGRNHNAKVSGDAMLPIIAGRSMRSRWHALTQKKRVCSSPFSANNRLRCLV